MHVRSNEVRDDLRLAGDSALPESDDAGEAMAVEEELCTDDASMGLDKDEDVDDDGSIPEEVLEAADVRKGPSRSSLIAARHATDSSLFIQKSAFTSSQGASTPPKPSSAHTFPPF